MVSHLEPKLETSGKLFDKESVFKHKQKLRRRELEFKKRKYEEDKLKPVKKRGRFDLLAIAIMVLIVLGMLALVVFLGLL